MVRWQYKVVELPVDATGMDVPVNNAPVKDLTKANDTLKAFGDEGWELVSTTPNVFGNYSSPSTTSFVLWFKRPVA